MGLLYFEYLSFDVRGVAEMGGDLGREPVVLERFNSMHASPQRLMALKWEVVKSKIKKETMGDKPDWRFFIYFIYYTVLY